MMEEPMSNQFKEPAAIPCIDNLDISDKAIEECKIAYEKYGKEAAYKTLDKVLYNKEPSQSYRGLYLYRKAMYLTRKAFHLGNGYVEKELVFGQENQFNIASVPLWKRTKWSFVDENAEIRVRGTNNQYSTQSRFRLDDYGKSKYDLFYGDSTKLTMKRRGGEAVTRRTRFDFEYKYSSRDYYYGKYLRYIYNTLRRVVFITTKHSVYNSLSPEETNLLYTITGCLPNIMKLSIVENLVDFILYEKEGPAGNHIDILPSFKTFLSDLHDALLLPFEFISYLMCALVNPRYEAIIEDSKGNVGTHVFGGNNHVFPGVISPLGPALVNDKEDTVSALIENIGVLSQSNIILFENIFIHSDQEYNIKCYSYNENKYLSNIPLLNKDAIPFLNKGEERKLISITQAYDENEDRIVWFIYSDYIISYNANAHEWITVKDGDPFHLAGYDIKALFPQENECTFSLYDKDNHILIFVDNAGNIASYDIKSETSVPYNSGDTGDFNETIHFDISDNPEGIIDIKKLFILDNKDEYTLFGYNDRMCQIITYNDEEDTVKKNYQFDFYDGYPIVDVIKLNDGKAIYIIFANHKIIELSTYLYKPLVFQNGNETQDKIIVAGKSYCNMNEMPLYITSGNKIHILHPLYNTKNRVSRLSLPVEKYVNKGAVLSRYKEYFIQPSSISVFTNQYYALTNHTDSLKPHLTKRS
jgi:hypothetical protein